MRAGTTTCTTVTATTPGPCSHQAVLVRYQRSHQAMAVRCRLLPPRSPTFSPSRRLASPPRRNRAASNRSCGLRHRLHRPHQDDGAMRLTAWRLDGGPIPKPMIMAMVMSMTSDKDDGDERQWTLVRRKKS